MNIFAKRIILNRINSRIVKLCFLLYVCIVVVILLFYHISFLFNSRLYNALKHYENKEYSIAFEKCLPYAKKGNIESQFYIACMYYFGNGTNKDYNEAFKWFNLSAEKGLREAQYNLAQMYFNGYGVDKDYKKAFYWYEKSASQELAIAQVNLATCYISGLGSEKNMTKGIELLKNASKYNCPEAFARLGVIYYNGAGIKQNYEEAFQYFLKAAKNNNNESQYIIGTMYIQAKGVENNLQEGRKWIYLSAKNGFKVAELYMCFLYLSQGRNEDANKFFQNVMHENILPPMYFPDSRGADVLCLNRPQMTDIHNAWFFWGEKEIPCPEDTGTIKCLQVTMRVLGQSNNPTAPQLVPLYIEKTLHPDLFTDIDNKNNDWRAWTDDMLQISQ